MKNNNKTFLYLNYHSLPNYKSPNQRLLDFDFCYYFLFFFKNKYKVISIDHIGVNGYLDKEGIAYHFLKKKHNSKVIVPFKLHLQIRRLLPDVIYLQGFLYLHFILFLLPVLKKRPIIIVQHHAEKLPDSWWKRKILGWLNNFVDGYVFTSKEMALPWIHKGIISSSSKIIEQPEVSTHFRFSESVKKDDNLFLWVGRLNNNKDPITVIKGFLEYHQYNKKSKMVMFFHESPILSEVEYIIKENKAQSFILLKGKMPHKDLELWYQKSSYFVLGSHYEGGPVSLIEAMACGCIPIVTKIPAVQKMTNNGELGLLFEPGNSEDLFNKLKSLSRMDTKKQRIDIIDYFLKNMSFNALARGLDNFVKNQELEKQK